VTATGSGIATASFTGGGAGCTFSHVAFLASGTVPPCPGYAFPHGLVEFTTRGCTPGATLQLSFTAPQPLSPGTDYWKFGPTLPGGPPHWYEIDAVVNGATITFFVQDGGQGDDDLSTNGSITDQSGPAVQGEAQAETAIPALGARSLLLLAALLALVGAAALRRLT